MKINWLHSLLIVIIATPVVTADTVKFIAGNYASDASSIIGPNTVEHAAIFGNAGTATSPDGLQTIVLFNHTVTNFTVIANTPGCGSYVAGESVRISLQHIQLGIAIFSVDCLGNAVDNQVFVDNTTFNLTMGDSLMLAFENINTPVAISRQVRVGVSFEGIVNTTVTPDMVNEIIEALNLFLPLIVFVLLILWAEVSRIWLVYILAILAGVITITSLWTEVENLRVITVGALLLVIGLSFYRYKEGKKNEN